jgi:hypothetical protein
MPAKENEAPTMAMSRISYGHLSEDGGGDWRVMTGPIRQEIGI